MERPFDYPDRHSDDCAPDPSHMVRADNAGGIRHSEGELGEYMVMIAPYFVPDWWDSEDIARVVEEKFPAEHCQHEHDCCGHWYPGRGRAVDIVDTRDDNNERAKLVLVRVRWTMNI